MSPKDRKPRKPLDIYTRVSRIGDRDADSEAFGTVETQVERCRAIATAKDLRVGEVLPPDLDESGGKMDRPSLNLALERIREGKSGGIIVARLDRFSRSLQGALNTLQEIEKAGGVLVAADGDFDTTTPMGAFARDMMLRVAQLYRDQTTAAWRDSQGRARRRGVHIAPRVPFGYDRKVLETRKDGRAVHGELVQNEDAKLVKHIYEMRGRGRTCQDCADYLNEHGALTSLLGDGSGPTGGGNPFTESAVRKLVQNPIYKGEPNGGADLPKSARDSLRIVSPLVWKRAQPERNGRRQRSEEHLLSGLVKCGSCGGTMTASVNRKKRIDGTAHAASHYTCRQRAVSALEEPCPQPVTVSGALLEPAVEDELFARLGKPTEPDLRGFLIVGAGDESELREALADAEHELAEVEALQGELRPAAYAVALDMALTAVERARANLEQSERVVQVDETTAPAIWEVRQLHDDAPVANRRAVIARGLGSITVAPRTSRTQPITERITFECGPSAKRAALAAWQARRAVPQEVSTGRKLRAPRGASALRRRAVESS